MLRIVEALNRDFQRVEHSINELNQSREPL